MPDCRRQAFTLIELLVVIAIIAVLAAILFPVFASANVTAKNVACLSNMRQIGFALQMYVPDNSEMWPSASINNPLAGFAPQQIWIGYDNNNLNGAVDGGFYGNVNRAATGRPRPGAIDVYLKSYEVRKCPSMPKNWQMAVALSWWNPGFESAYYSRNPQARGNEYGVGSKVFQYGPNGTYETLGAPDADMERSAETIVAFEHNARVPMCNALQVRDWYDSAPKDVDLEAHFEFLHRGGANVVFGDAHTVHMDFKKFKRPMFSMLKYIYPR